MAWRSRLSPSCQRPCFFSEFDDFARHVALIVLGQDRFGAKLARRFQHAFGDDALPFAEQVGRQSLIGNFHILGVRR